MPDTYENQTQTNTDGSALPAGEPKVSQQDPARDDASFASRPSDTEAAHHNEGGHSWRSQSHGDIGGDMGRDESKGAGQGEGGGAPEGLPPTAPGGEMEHQDPAHADDLDKAIDQRTGGQGQDDLGGDYDQTYNPDQVEANRMREQGGGVGQKDIDAQRDPNRANRTDQY
jgi:hypothetical protein